MNEIFKIETLDDYSYYYRHTHHNLTSMEKVTFCNDQKKKKCVRQNSQPQ